MRWRPRRAEIEVIEGADRGQRRSVPPGGLRVGSGRDAGLHLDDSWVGRRHLQLMRTEDGVLVVDLGAAGGTKLEGHRVERVLLCGTAQLDLGATVLRVELGASDELRLRDTLGTLAGWSPPLRHALHRLAEVAQSEATVLLEGDPGVGKDALARALHEEGRGEAPFVVVDGASPDVTEALFGRRDRGRWLPGAAQQAEGGTLFIDDAGELPRGAQLRLATALDGRVLEGGEPLRARVVLATSQRLAELSRRGKYASNLVDRIERSLLLPPLAFRPEDVVPLAERFWQGARDDDESLPTPLSPMLESYHWPGNVRELRAVVEQLAAASALEAAARPAGPSFARYDHLPYHDAKKLLVNDFQRWLLPQVVERCGGSVARAAGVLGIPRTSLYRMLDEDG